MPNDDLDIQLLWLIAIEEKGVNFDAKLLGEYFNIYVDPHWNEYGTAKINMKQGLMPPLSGSFKNVYKDSCGSFIRTEIWACIAPGCPEIAAKFAFEDSIIDHGDGEGTYAAVFCAAMESAAFIEKDIRKLIDIGLSYIPENCGVAQAIISVINSYTSGKTWLKARDEILEKFRGTPTSWSILSETDLQKGFEIGKRGYDAPSNMGMLVIGMVYGEGDFSKSLCTIINCGEDTDCTGAAYGSIFGIIHGIDDIPKEWIEPIGRGIKTYCLNLGDLGGYRIPQNIDTLSESVEDIAKQAISVHHMPIIFANNDGNLSDTDRNTLFASKDFKSIFEYVKGPLFKFDFFNVLVDYKGDPTIRDGEPKEIRIVIGNCYKIQEYVSIK